MDIRVATYNIRAGLSDGYFRKKNYLKAADVISQIDADIIALNEVGKHVPKEIREHAEFLAKQCGYKYHRFGKATMFGAYPYGNAVLSKHPIDAVSVIPVKKFVQILPGIYEPRCIIAAQIRLDKPIRVLAAHFGLFPDEQRLAVEKIAQLAESSELPTVFMGDLNIASPSERLTSQLGKQLRDACELRGASLNTYPSAKPRKRLDYIFVSNSIDVRNVFVVNEAASDHLPLVADISV